MPTTIQSPKTRHEFAQMIAYICTESSPYKKFIVRFTAGWCKPCKTISPTIDRLVELLPESTGYVVVNIDESNDLYSFLKSKHVIGGVPTVSAYYSERDPDVMFYLPDDQVSGTDVGTVERFFARQM